VIGSGLFKTCISVIVGTLYQAQDSRRDAGFSIFYMGINLGSLIAPLLTGLLVKEHGWHWGFGIGGVGMLIALLIFKLITVPQLKQFNHVRGNENNWARPVHYNPKAPQMIIGFLAVVGLIIGLVSLGIININPIQIATYFTITICICIALYFCYLLLFAGLNNTEKKQIIICFILLITAALFWSAFEQNQHLLIFSPKTLQIANSLALKYPQFGFNRLTRFSLLFSHRSWHGFGLN
jgi:POT family proton-dependent oligopeptide transporter